MAAWWNKITSSPLLVRVAPFAVFLVLTSLQGRLGEASQYWMYLAKTAVGGVLVWQMRRYVAEIEWRFTGAAIGAGILVFLLWIGLEDGVRALGFAHSYPKFVHPTAVWNPLAFFAGAPAIGWMFAVVRILGATLVVPPLEEVFYRSFLYRYLQQTDFLGVPLTRFSGFAFILTSAIFASTHVEWLAALLCGFIYQGLVGWKGRLGDAIAAHALTNLLLGIWVVSRGAWHFW